MVGLGFGYIVTLKVQLYICHLINRATLYTMRQCTSIQQRNRLLNISSST